MDESSSQSDNDIQWPAHLPQLKMLDHHLRCPICYNFFDKPVLATGCSHTFCSLCIRKYISIKNSCPVCSLEVTDRMLKSNRILDDIIMAYHPIRNFILTGEKSSKNSVVVVPENETSPKIPRIENPEENFVNKSAFSETTKDTKPIDQPSTSRSHNQVQCPICLIDVDESKINTHLDACLKSKETSTKDEKPPPRKPMPKLIYAIMQEKELRKRLKALGLSHQGDKKTLINRHKKYTNLYNAESDAANPRSNEELIRELEREEAAEKKLATGRKQVQVQPHPERGKLSEEAIDKMNQEYLKRNREHFQKLIDEIKERKKLDPPTAKEKNDEEEIVVLPQEPKVFEEISLLDEDDSAEQSDMSISNLSNQIEASTPQRAFLGSLGYVNTAGRSSPTYSPVPSPSGSSSTDPFPDSLGRMDQPQDRCSRNRRAQPESPSDERNPPRRFTRRKI